jgi:hypothetical protein
MDLLPTPGIFDLIGKPSDQIGDFNDNAFGSFVFHIVPRDGVCGAE